MTDVSMLCDRDLVARTVNGETTAYGAIYDRYFDQIYRFVYFRVSDQKDTEDLVEAVFLKTFQRLRTNRSQIDNIKAWLYRTASNLVIDYYRTRKETLPMEALQNTGDESHTPEASVIVMEEQKHLLAALDKLEPEQQKVIVLRFVSGLSYEETAQLLGIKINYLRVVQYRALQKLRQILKEGEPHGEIKN
jgi:RNA polymerase sigma-70 factor, ECF subfamily